jgi:hypothetical protein
MATNPEPARPGLSQEERATLILGIGTVVGLALLITGAVLTYQWWSAVTGGMEEWRKEWWRIALCFLAGFGGLAIMFASLSFARGQEHTSPWMRRLLYGYNAVLSALLLVAILAVFNVLSYVPFRPFSYLNATYDWTEATLYTLSPESREFLSKLDKPVKVYVLLPGGDEFVGREVRTLMDNVRGVTKQVEVVYLSPDYDRRKMLDLEQTYQIPERQGLLVVYGDERPENSEFIKYDDIFAVKRNFRDPNDKPRVQFKGESSFIKALSFLVEGKSKTVVYFTQGNGELDLNSMDQRGEDSGMGRLRDRLSHTNYEIKELKFDPADPKVPDDASIVVIARPTIRFTGPMLTALHNYMSPADSSKPKGKLIVLFDVYPPRGPMAQTGLEEFVAQYGAQVGNDRILSMRTSNPLDVVVTAGRVENPITSRFRGVGFTLRDVRTVQPQPANPGAPQQYRAEALLVAAPQYLIWSEPNLAADPTELVNAFKKPDRLKDLQAKISQTALPVAVAVTESGPPPAGGADPHDFMRQGGEQIPRLLVYGDASWLSNRWMGEGELYDLFTGSLAWLRERPDVASVAEPKERKPYIMNTKPAAPMPGETEPPSSEGALRTREEVYSRLFWVPALLMVVGIIGLGTGVWVVRRR